MHFQQIPHHRDRFYPLEEYDDEDFRLCFRLRKDSVIDLLKILNQDLSTKGVWSAAYTADALIFILLWDFIQQVWTFEQVIGDLFSVSVFAACTRFHGLSWHEKNIPCHSLRTWDILRERFVSWGRSKITAVLLTILLFCPFSWHLLLSCEFLQHHC